MPSTSRPLSFVPKYPSLLQDRADEPTADDTGCNNSSASTFSVGLRVVGWKSVDAGSESGEGFVGTVVEVGSDSSSLAENTAVIQWDIGTREVYRAEHHGGQQISVLDNCSVGIKHRGITCSACKQSPIAGIRWNCLDCKDPSVNLCTSCYMDDKHEREHVFLRFDGSGKDGIPVERRSVTNKIQARGIYPDAIVTKGPDWEYDDQDGGRFGSVTKITSWQGNPASAARVAWVSGTEGTYRLGYKGKVDLQCITASSGGYCYKSHLPRLGPSKQITKDAVKSIANQPGCSKTSTGDYSNGSTASASGVADDTVTQSSEELTTTNASSYVDSDSQKASRSKLHKASICGQLQTVKILLDAGKDVNQGDKFSLTPLHLAAWYGQESTVQMLLERGANVNATDMFQKTPLKKAERHNHTSVMQILKKHGATSTYQQPLSLMSLSKVAVLTVDQSSGFNLLQAAVFEGKFNTVLTLSVFLDNFAREMNFESTANNAKVSPSKTPCDMFSTLDSKEHAKIKDLYEETLDKQGTLTALHHCRDNNDAEMSVELVLHHGMDVDTPATGNRTPLLWASLRSSSTLIKTLLDLGADVNAKREDRCIPLELAVNWNNYMAVRLLLEHGADVNMSRNGETALHRAVRFGGFEVTELLIKSGCNVNSQDDSGKTLLHRADVNARCWQNSKERIFLVRGKDEGKPAWHYVDVKKALVGLFHKRIKDGSLLVTNFGTVLASGWGQNPPDLIKEEISNVEPDDCTETQDKTALHIACEVSDESIIELLVKQGADINACDADGFTPLQLAAIRGNMQAVKKLVELKADVNITTADGKDAAAYAQLNEETEIEEYLKSKRSPFRKLWNKVSRKR